MSTSNEQLPPQPRYGQYAPQPGYPPPAYPPPAYAPPPIPKAPAGTDPSTIWIWLIAVAIPLLSCLLVVPLFLAETTFITQFMQTMMDTVPSDGGRLTPSESQALSSELFSLMGPFFGWSVLVWLGGLVLTGLMVLFAWLDHRELLRRGVPKPFHWGWSFLAFAGAGNLVTVIGRSVVANRRTGRGLAPIWVTIGVYVVCVVVLLVVMLLMLGAAFSSIPFDYGTYAPSGRNA